MIAVIIPSYKCSDAILGVIDSVDPSADRIYVVDDACPQGTGKHVEAASKDPRVRVLYHEENKGVGGAVITGYLQARKDGCRFAVKIDGDGQMDGGDIPLFLGPLTAGQADYTKGNRFYRLSGIDEMPRKRIFGNAVLSFLSKLSSGYWHVFDPTNGYTALNLKLLDVLDVEKVANRYFFESDMLFRLGLCQARVLDIPMSSRYAGEVSNLSEFGVIPSFLKNHLRNFTKRMLYCYFLRDFSIASLELFVGTLLVAFGTVFGASAWWKSIVTMQPSSSGTVMLSALPVILGTQFLLNFLSHDIQRSPDHPVHSRL